MGIREFLCITDGRCRRVVGIVWLLILAGSARAQSSNFGLDSVSQSRAVIERPEPTAIEETKQPSRLDMSLSQQYFSSVGQVGMQRQDYTNLGLDLDLHSRGKDVDMAAHGIYQGSMQSSQEQYFGMPELYIGESQNSNAGVRVAIGRQKRHWSQFDEEFGIGLWQPQLSWDLLNPIQQGLTGLFVDLAATRTLTMTLFLSTIYLPDQGPNFQLQNGQFESQNRWFWAPQVNLQFNRTQTQVSYGIDKPSVNDVIIQPSVGGMIRYQSYATPIWAQISWAYMPMNQLHYAYDCPECADPTNLDVQATIHPTVLKHRVATAEVGVADDQQKAWLSSTLDVPDTPTGPSQWIQSSYDRVVYVAGSYEHSLPLFRRPGSIKVSYLKAFESKNAIGNSLVEEPVEASIDRVPYQELAAIEWNWLVMKRKLSQVAWHLRYSYSVPEQGGWLSSTATLQMKKWSWYLGVDVIGANVDPTSPSAGLFSRYRANDRAMTGMGYVF